MICSRTILTMFIAIFTGGAAYSQQYRNFEVQPDGTGGYYGTYGNQNFEVRPGAGQSGHLGGRRPNVIEERRSRRPGSVGATQRNCVVDGNGMAICR
jgi:hypothetical protein